MRSLGPLEGWVQGDCIRGPIPARPDVEIWAVISQTCDLVSARPWVQLAPIIDLPENRAGNARSGRQPRHIAVEQVGHNSFTDLDEVLTIRKDEIVGLEVLLAPRSDEWRRTFGRAIGRYYSRAALADDINLQLEPILKYLRNKDGKQSAEGDLLGRVLSELRIMSDEDWTEATLLLILRDDDLPGPEELVDQPSDRARFDGCAPPKIAGMIAQTPDPAERAGLWQLYAGLLAEKLGGGGPLEVVEGLAVPEHELTYRDLRTSDRIDLDYLSDYDTAN